MRWNGTKLESTSKILLFAMEFVSLEFRVELKELRRYPRITTSLLLLLQFVEHVSNLLFSLNYSRVFRNSFIWESLSSTQSHIAQQGWEEHFYSSQSHPPKPFSFTPHHFGCIIIYIVYLYDQCVLHFGSFVWTFSHLIWQNIAKVNQIPNALLYNFVDWVGVQELAIVAICVV